MKEINFGIIGCGDVTEVKSGPAFQKLEGSRLLGVMRRDEKKLEDYARRHGVPKYSTNYLDLLQDESIDAIYIATPPKHHHFYTLEAARYGKAIYVEKPMAMSVEECREMLRVTAENQVPLFVAYYRRGQEKFRTAKELIAAGELGEVTSFHYIYTCRRPQLSQERSWIYDKEESGGFLYDIGSHMVDMILYLCGEVKLASGISQAPKEADVYTGRLVFHNGIEGTLHLSFQEQESCDELVISGSEGSMRFSIMSNDPITVCTKKGERVLSFAALEHVQMPYIKRVVDTLLEKDDYDTRGLYGLRTQEILEVLRDRTTLQYN